MLGFFATLRMTFVEGVFQHAAKPVDSVACLGTAQAVPCSFHLCAAVSHGYDAAPPPDVRKGLPFRT